MPRKPFPLSYHPGTNQFYKKIRGKRYYFGADKDKALARYLDEREQLQAGVNPRDKKQGLTIGELANKFLSFKRGQVDAGELTVGTWRDYHLACTIITEFFPKRGVRMVSDLLPEHFEALRAKLAKTSAPVTLGNWIRRIRVIMNWAEENGEIDQPVKMGVSFKLPSAKTLRKAKQTDGKIFLEPAELRLVLETAKQPLRAMVLLGLNAALGPSDLAALPISAIDLETGWLDFPRPKTAIPRRCKLWPETVSALSEAIKTRPAAKNPADAGLAFITLHGNRWVRIREKENKPGAVIDSVNLEYGKILKALNLKEGRGRQGFYALRHIHRTIADGSKDAVACDLIMGHVDASMGGNYRHRIDDSRLKAVTDLVRVWLWHPPLLAPADRSLSPDGE